MLLIHGVGLRAEAWAPQIADLAQDHAVYAVDMPGDGGSDPLGGGRSWLITLHGPHG